MPRILFALDFGAFRDAGAAPSALHLGYATGREYALPVDVKVIGDGIYRLNHRKMP